MHVLPLASVSCSPEIDVDDPRQFEVGIAIIVTHRQSASCYSPECEATPRSALSLTTTNLLMIRRDS